MYLGHDEDRIREREPAVPLGERISTIAYLFVCLAFFGYLVAKIGGFA